MLVTKDHGNGSKSKIKDLVYYLAGDFGVGVGWIRQ